MKKGLLFIAFFFLSGFLHADEDPLKGVAAELADGIARHPKVKVAVLAVPHHDNHLSDGPFLVSERLTNYLATNKRLSVVDRNHIAQLLSEAHLSETGVLDAATAQLIGRVVGADVIVTGTLIDLDQGKTEINVRGLFVNNGRIIAASRAFLDRTWESRPVLGW